MKLMVCRIMLFLFFSQLAALGSEKNSEFKRIKIRLGNQTIVVDLADTNETRAKGLMYRKILPDGEGCLFVFDAEAVRSFWMKNTFLPLSIGFFDRKGRLFEIQDMQPVNVGDRTSEPMKVYKSLGPAKFALEVPLGWFGRTKIGVGTKLEFL